MFLKISGVTPERLHDLHETLKSNKVRGLRAINRPTTNSHPEQIVSPTYARLLRNKMSEANGSYTLELRVDVDAVPSRVASFDPNKRVMVSRKVVDALFDALGIFPEEEQLAPTLDLGYDEEEDEETL